jgi:hypothetical protein
MNNLHHSALERYDIKRYPVEIAKIPDRDGTVSAGKEHAVSFSEVIDRVRQNALPDEGTTAPKANGSGKSFSLWERADAAFGDLLDVINPLHHIPIVATFYRNMSGDKIGVVSRVVGGALWGRLGGLVAGVVNAVVDWITGKDIGDHIYAAVFGDPSNAESVVAESRGTFKSENQDADQSVHEASSPSAGELAVTGALFEDDGIVVPGTKLGSTNEFPAEARAWKPDDAPDRSWAISSYVRNRVLEDVEEPFRIRHRA